MNLLLVGTVNGKFNEGMRNVATHIGQELGKKHTVRYIQLKDLGGLLSNLIWSDRILICARADKKLYWYVRALSWFRKCSVILVQKPDEYFLNRCKKKALSCQFFTITMSDAACVPNASDIVRIPVGIDTERFFPVSDTEKIALKQSLGIDPQKCCVLHVGHCSAGRRVEKLCGLDSNEFERIVITSGMFEDARIKRMLESDGVRVLSGYQPNIEVYYQAADVYFFPTISGNYVISIPLSVMEALACGTAVVGYKHFPGIQEIESTDPNAMLLIGDSDNIAWALKQQAQHTTNANLLQKKCSWGSVAEIVSNELEKKS